MDSLKGGCPVAECPATGRINSRKPVDVCKKKEKKALSFRVFAKKHYFCRKGVSVPQKEMQKEPLWMGFAEQKILSLRKQLKVGSFPTLR